MRIVFPILCLLSFALPVAAQKKFNKAVVDSFFSDRPVNYKKTERTADIIHAIEAVDKKFNTIVDSLFKLNKHVHTFSKTGHIKIRQLMPYQQAVTKLLSDTASMHTNAYTTFVNDHDSIRLLETELQAALYRPYYGEDVYGVDISTVNALRFGKDLQLEQICLYDGNVASKITTYLKTLPKKEQDKAAAYLEKNYFGFIAKSRDLQPQSVRIVYITFGEANLVYAGLDIYGSHYLWTIDKNRGWDVVKVDDLWIY